MKENVEAAEIYMTVRGQVITVGGGMGGAIVMDVSIPAIESAMRLRRIRPRDRWQCLVRVQKVFHHFLKKGQGQK
jgi:hypothetical protein